MIFGTVLLAALLQQAPAFDVVIRGGRVLDGTGNPYVYADVLVNGAFVVDDGKPTAAKPGRMLTRQRTARRP